MVRAGVVDHPSEWAWCGYQELLGLRKRYLVVAMKELAEVLGPGLGAEEVFRRYAEYVGEGIKAGELSRDARWTESVAVGREVFVREVGAHIEHRMHMAFRLAPTGAGPSRRSRVLTAHFPPQKTPLRPQKSMFSRCKSLQP